MSNLTQNTTELNAIKELINSLPDYIDPAKAPIPSDAITALTDKGVTVPSGADVSGLAALISAIESGGGGIKAAYGVIIPADDLYICEIVHSLGVIPNFALIVGGYSNSKAVNQSLSTITFGEEDYVGNVEMIFENVRATTTSNTGVRAQTAVQASDGTDNLAWTPNSETTQGYNQAGGLFYGADTSKIYYGHPTLQKYFLKNTVQYFYLIGYLDGFYVPYE